LVTWNIHKVSFSIGVSVALMDISFLQNYYLVINYFSG